MGCEVGCGCCNGLGLLDELWLLHGLDELWLLHGLEMGWGCCEMPCCWITCGAAM